jgi:Tol biopolymer transport system component
VPIDQFRWMPDSRHVIFPFHRNEGEGLHLWIADTGNASLQQVTSGGGNETNPAVSPDGHTVAYTAYDHQQDLMEISLEGGGMHPFLATSRSERSAQWSPSGHELVYVTDRSGAPEVWLTTHDKTRAWPIVTQKDFGSDDNLRLTVPRFSPDGQRIAYERFGGIRGKSGAIWISPVGGGTPVRAVEESEENSQMSPTWSPDGNSIAFLLSRSGLFGLAKVAAGGGAHAQMLKDKVESAFPEWSPKGDLILYSMPNSLWVISADGKTDRMLSDRKWDLYTWSKDGARVYAIRPENRNYVIYAIDAQSGIEKKLSEFERPHGIQLAGPLSLSPDGKSVTATLNHPQGDIWLLQSFKTPGGLLRRLWRW